MEEKNISELEHDILLAEEHIVSVYDSEWEMIVSLSRACSKDASSLLKEGKDDSELIMLRQAFISACDALLVQAHDEYHSSKREMIDIRKSFLEKVKSIRKD